MLNDFVRNFFIIINSFYTFYKLLNIQPKNKLHHLSYTLFSLLISSFCTLLFNKNITINWLIIFILSYLTLKLNTCLNISTIYLTILFSFALNFIIFGLSGILSLFISVPLFYGETELPWFLMHTISGIIHSWFIFNCFHFPRLQKGMTFLYHIPSGNIGSTLCVLIFMLIFHFSHPNTLTDTFLLIFSLIILILLFLLLYWWNYHLTQTYKKYIKRNELSSLEILLSKKDTEIEYLKTENDKLSRLIHKDNKMLPALTLAVQDFLQKANNLSSSELEQLGSSLQTQLTLLYEDRLAIMNSYEQDLFPLPSTDFASVNGVLMFMRKKAADAGIEFQLLLSHPLTAAIPSSIPEKDFSHLLSDLLDNAIIAAKSSPSGRIQIHMGMFDKIYTLKVTNTGNSFPIEVLQDLGINKHTTHKDSGGSGIGLMDIWKIKEDCSATLLIDEITASSSETTSTTINILFNKKRHFIIHTDRYKELTRHLNRPDLMILPKE